MNNNSEAPTKFKILTPQFVESLKSNLEILGSKYSYFMSGILILQLILIPFPMSLRIIFGVALLSLLSFSIFSPLSSGRTKELSYVGFKISIVFLVYNIFMFIGQLMDSSEFSVASMKPFMFLLSTVFSIVIVSMYIQKDKRTKIDEILLSLQGLRFIRGKLKDKSSIGDVKICVNADTDEDIIIPFKDRFLHMLILGPTGSGKTSQTIIPMINQDMQNMEFGITVIEPKGDLAERVYAMASYYGREAVYFNPTHPDCPYFNPLYGDESEVIENMATTFKMLSASEKSNPFFDNMNENLIRNALKLLKRLKGNNATLVDLSTIVYNSQGQGKIMVNQFARVKTKTIEEAKENGDIASWFLSDYYNERSKTYEHCSGLRSQVSKITSNIHLRRVLNPPDGRNDVDFGAFIEEGKILAISTAQGELRELSTFLGYFIILNFQSAVFKRPGNEDTRRPHFLYIDEFQKYSNPGFADMLTQGRSYKVASHLATQNRVLMAMGGGKDGNNFVELVSTNARNIIFFPGANSKDAKYYSDEFGESLKKKREKSVNRSKFSMLYSMKKIGPPSESIRETEQMGSRFSPSDLIYRDFGEISYRIVYNNTVQAPGIGKVAWIPKAFNDELTEMIANYHEGNEMTKIDMPEEDDDMIVNENEDIDDLINDDPLEVVINFDGISAGDKTDVEDEEINIDPFEDDIAMDEPAVKDKPVEMKKPESKPEVKADENESSDVIDFDIDFDYDDEDTDDNESSADMMDDPLGENRDKDNNKDAKGPAKENTKNMDEGKKEDEPIKDILDYEDFDDLI